MAQGEAEVKLQPPGAGLPPAELFLARVVFRAVTPLISRRRASRRFRAEADRILALARSLDPADAARPVLIPRIWGIEDSSRYWSVFMTLEHLVIVDTAVAGFVEQLVAGTVPAGAVSTADVKPGPATEAAVVERFESAARDYLARIDALPDLRSKVAHRHPWFGPLSALNWHRLAALHHTVHRRQVERIIRSLRRRASTS